MPITKQSKNEIMKTFGDYIKLLIYLILSVLSSVILLGYYYNRIMLGVPTKYYFMSNTIITEICSLSRGKKEYNIKDIKRSYGNGRIFFHVVLSDDITEQHVVELFRNVIYKHIKNRKQGIILIIKTEKGESQNCYQLTW